MNSYKDLIVWQKAIELTVLLYKITGNFPKSEMYGLTSQIRRAAVAIPSNIAEGQRRGHRPEYLQFLRIAYGSGAELETQLLISLKIGYLPQKDFNKVSSLLEEVMKMLTVLIRSLSSVFRT